MNQKDTPIRIMRLITRLNISGPAVHAVLLTSRLRSRGYECSLVCGRSNSPQDDMSYLAQQYEVEPIWVDDLNYTLNPIRVVLGIWRLYRLIGEIRPDIVHTHVRTAGFMGRLAAWLAGVPVIVHTFHEYPLGKYINPLQNGLFIWIERLMARFSNIIITLTENLRRDMVETYRITRRSHVTVLPLGLDLDQFANTKRKSGVFRAEHQLAPEIPLVGIVGRLISVKNHALFLEAAEKVKTHIPDAHFVIVGDGPLRQALAARIDESNLRGSVIFTGWQKDVAAVYGDLDVNVISSDNEGTPVPIIEALAAGCPVVATSVGGLPELLDQGALGKLVPPRDAAALAHAIIETLQNPPDVSTAQQAMINRYGIERLIHDMDSLYRGLLLAQQRKKSG